MRERKKTKIQIEIRKEGGFWSQSDLFSSSGSDTSHITLSNQLISKLNFLSHQEGQCLFYQIFGTFNYTNIPSIAPASNEDSIAINFSFPYSFFPPFVFLFNNQYQFQIVLGVWCQAWGSVLNHIAKK